MILLKELKLNLIKVLDLIFFIVNKIGEGVKFFKLCCLKVSYKIMNKNSFY